MSRLPSPSPRRLAVRITPDALRQVRGGSPWIFDGSITSVRGAEEAAPGDLAVVFDQRREFAAIGLWDPGSPIRVRVLHTGRPTPIDDLWWRSRLDEALARRGALVTDPDTTAYRVVHGENDGFGGLVVDRYDTTLVLKLYSDVWWSHLRPVLDALVDALDPDRIVLRLGRAVTPPPGSDLADGVTLLGDPPEGPISFRERGLWFEADVRFGPKTGHFLDQRDNRGLVRGMAEGAAVLDVFASTGGFSVSAAAGGARSVHLVDVSAPALEVARRNLSLNRHIGAVRACEVTTAVGDAVEVLGSLARMPGRFDLVIVDPPSFAHDAAGVPAARRAYTRVVRAALRVVRPGGTLVQASCSSRIGAEEFFDLVRAAAAAERVPFRELRHTGHPLDHPVGFEQGAYLKAVFATVG